MDHDELYYKQYSTDIFNVFTLKKSTKLNAKNSDICVEIFYMCNIQTDSDIYCVYISLRNSSVSVDK